MRRWMINLQLTKAIHSLQQPFLVNSSLINIFMNSGSQSHQLPSQGSHTYAYASVYLIIFLCLSWVWWAIKFLTYETTRNWYQTLNSIYPKMPCGILSCLGMEIQSSICPKRYEPCGKSMLLNFSDVGFTKI